MGKVVNMKLFSLAHSAFVIINLMENYADENLLDKTLFKYFDDLQKKNHIHLDFLYVFKLIYSEDL